MMQTLPPIFYEDRQTLTIQTQAIEQTIQAMHTHLQELQTLEELASVACLSTSHFHHVFCRLIGIPPGQFLAALRFQAARDLLVTTSLSVTDICFEVGYTSLGSFSSRFTQFVGLSPRLLRQRAHVFEPLPVVDSAFDPTPIDPILAPTLANPALNPTLANSPLNPTEVEATKHFPITFSNMKMQRTLIGQINAPAPFRGTIFLGLFRGPIPQGAPVYCTKLTSPGRYQLSGIADGLYYLRAAAFPIAKDLHSSLVPGKKLLLASNATPLIVHHGSISGNPNLLLHPPLLTDPPLVMGLPLL